MMNADEQREMDEKVRHCAREIAKACFMPVMTRGLVLRRYL
jgi:hypothetical protein